LFGFVCRANAALCDLNDGHRTKEDKRENAYSRRFLLVAISQSAYPKSAQPKPPLVSRDRRGRERDRKDRKPRQVWLTLWQSKGSCLPTAFWCSPVGILSPPIGTMKSKREGCAGVVCLRCNAIALVYCLLSVPLALDQRLRQLIACVSHDIALQLPAICSRGGRGSLRRCPSVSR